MRVEISGALKGYPRERRQSVSINVVSESAFFVDDSGTHFFAPYIKDVSVELDGYYARLALGMADGQHCVFHGEIVKNGRLYKVYADYFLDLEREPSNSSIFKEKAKRSSKVVSLPTPLNFQESADFSHELLEDSKEIPNFYVDNDKHLMNWIAQKLNEEKQELSEEWTVLLENIANETMFSVHQIRDMWNQELFWNIYANGLFQGFYQTDLMTPEEIISRIFKHMRQLEDMALNDSKVYFRGIYGHV